MYLFCKLHWWWEEHKPHPIAFWQRGRRGWADRDTWSFDTYLSGVLADGLLYLADTKHGHPCRGVAPEDCKTCACEKLWDKELRENAEKFRLLHEGDWGTSEELENLDCVRKEACEWLAEWYGALWD